MVITSTFLSRLRLFSGHGGGDGGEGRHSITAVRTYRLYVSFHTKMISAHYLLILSMLDSYLIQVCYHKMKVKFDFG